VSPAIAIRTGASVVVVVGCVVEVVVTTVDPTFAVVELGASSATG